MKNLPIRRSFFFDRALSFAIKGKMDFRVLECGISKFIDVGGYRKRYMDYDIGQGYHLCNYLKVHIKNRVASGEYVPVNKDNNKIDPLCQFLNSDVIESYSGKSVWTIDINNCYWKTAYNIGVMNEDTYNVGMRKNREWKSGRVASIGSLGSVVRESVYEGGEMVGGIKIYRKPFNVVRLDVLDYVHSVCMDIISGMGSDFIMYLTDCFFVSSAGKEKVIADLERWGYECKESEIKITRVDISKTALVEWIKVGVEPVKIKYKRFNEREFLKNNI
ncbi:MAG: hypothetical protein WCT77_03580 [Bacteroidota bacterium]